MIYFSGCISCLNICIINDLLPRMNIYNWTANISDIFAHSIRGHANYVYHYCKHAFTHFMMLFGSHSISLISLYCTYSWKHMIRIHSCDNSINTTGVMTNLASHIGGHLGSLRKLQVYSSTPSWFLFRIIISITHAIKAFPLITYTFLNFSGATDDVREWRSNFISHFIGLLDMWLLSHAGF